MQIIACCMTAPSHYLNQGYLEYLLLWKKSPGINMRQLMLKICVIIIYVLQNNIIEFLPMSVSKNELNLHAKLGIYIYYSTVIYLRLLQCLLWWQHGCQHPWCSVIGVNTDYNIYIMIKSTNNHRLNLPYGHICLWTHLDKWCKYEIINICSWGTSDFIL